MTSYVALLRGINVGGHKHVAMADLCDLLAHVGCVDVRSLLQSGNLVFRVGKGAAEDLERMLEVEARKRLALDTTFFVRAAKDWGRIVARNPFPGEADRDPGHLVAMFFKIAPRVRDVEALQAAITGREVVRVSGLEGYFVYPDGIGRSRLTNAMIEKTLGTPATGRNWNTVLRLAKLLEAWRAGQRTRGQHE